MRQPEVAPLLSLVLAAVLALPVLIAAGDLLLAGAFVVEFVTDGRVAPLTRLTPAPDRSPLAIGVGGTADRYARAGLRARPLVVVHGFTPDGKDDPRAVRSAALLARAGFDVVVPTIPGLTSGRLRPEDAEPVVASVLALGGQRGRRVALLGVSVGAGPALLAAADPRVRDRIDTVVSVGGYASARELLRFFLTGDYGYDAERGHVDHDPDVVAAFVTANTDVLDEPLRRAIADGDRARVAALLAGPAPGLADLLDALSPQRVATSIAARLVLVHARADRTVPYTESLRLAATRPWRTRLVLLDALDHVEGPTAAGSWAGWRDVLTLSMVFFGILAAN